jgi:DUF4097 and DUF4098 domain-containing protein YvlB
MRVAFGAGGFAACLVAMGGCVVGDIGPADRFHEDFHYTFPVGQKARIDAESFNGAIDIEGWDRPEVEITGMKFASTESGRDAIRIDVHHTQDSVEVRAVRPSERPGNMGAKFTLHVPRNAEVDRVTTSNGSIAVQDVGRAAHLNSSNGPIRINGVRGEVEAHTSNGPIDAESLEGMAKLKTSNGHIRVDGIAGGLEAETSNGGITARLVSSPSAPVRLHTSNGPVDLTMEKAPQGDIRAETRNSPITLHLPAETSSNVTADTSNSSVKCDFDVAGDNEKGHLHGNIGAGGHAIELTTSNGPIRIVKGSGE